MPELTTGCCLPRGAWPAFSVAALAAKLFDKYHNYQMAFYTAAVLAAVALIAEFLARRPKHV